MREELKRNFLKNPAATEKDFKEIYPELRKRKLIDDALSGTGGPDNETLAYYNERFTKKA